MFGFARGEAFDNSFILMARNIIDFFDVHYYDKLRNSNRGQATFGATWGRAADWDNIMAQHGLYVVKRPGNPQCGRCLEEEEKTNSKCWQYLETECTVGKLHAALARCLGV